MTKKLTMITILTLLLVLTGCKTITKEIEVPFYVDKEVEVPVYVEGDIDATFDEVMQELIDNHFSAPDKEALWLGAIEGMIASLDDPHTSYFDLEE